MEITLTVLLAALFTAFTVSLLLTPLMIKIAPKLGAVDRPDGKRKIHSCPVPRLGGMAIFAGTMISMLVFGKGSEKLTPVMIGGALIYGLGAVDDFRNLSPKVKFGFEMLVAVLMYAMDLRIRFITNYFGGGAYRFGTVLCFFVTVIWIVGITNTINLIDGLDGLAAGIAAIAALCIAYVAYIHGDKYGMTIVCLAMTGVAGSALGFLPYNFYPAKIFMGDGGSLFLGFMMASLSVVGPLKRSTLIAITVPVLVLGIPIFDTFFAILRRLANKQPVMKADKGHLHHRLINSGYDQARAVLMLYGISAIMGMSAVLISRELYKDSLALIGIAAIYLYVFLTDTRGKGPEGANSTDEGKEKGKCQKETED